MKQNLIRVLVVLGFVISANNLNAQFGEKLKNVVNDIQSFAKQSSNTTRTTKNETDKTTGTVSPKQSNDLKPGDIHPNAKVLDVDYMWPFNKGAAMVKKGNAMGLIGLIDSAGNFIVPFGEKEPTSTGLPSGRGFFILKNSGGYASLINSKGKVLFIENADERIRGRSDISECVTVVNSRTNTYTYYDYDGKKYTVANALNDIVGGIGTTAIQKEGFMQGVLELKYKTLSNKFLPADNNLAFTYPFSEEMAVVGKANEYGEVKYGFINTKGELVIPYKFSKKPSEFIHGLSLVEPKDKTEFAYAFIDKKGDIKIKLTDKDVRGTPELFGYNSDDNIIAIVGANLLDINGAIIPKKNLFQRYGYGTNGTENFPNASFFYDWQRDKDIIWYLAQYPKPGPGAHTGYGFINIKKKIVVPPIFDKAGVFDPESKRAYVRTSIGKKDGYGVDIWREGYINDEGVFVIVKGKGDKW